MCVHLFSLVMEIFNSFVVVGFVNFCYVRVQTKVFGIVLSVVPHIITRKLKSYALLRCRTSEPEALLQSKADRPHTAAARL